VPTMGRVARKVLNLPEPEHKRTDPASPAGDWQAAAQRLKEADSQHPAASAQPEQRTPWSVEEERSGASFARRFGRGLLWTAVGLAALTGVREYVFPNDPAPPAHTAPDKQAAYPVADAQAVAARWTWAYLTWDEDHPESRAELLAADMPVGTDTSAGWDGHGQQSVLSVQPGAVTVTDGARARVHVTALVAPDAAAAEKGAKKAAVPDAHRMALEVPVVAVHGRVLVAGMPGLVGVPDTGPTVKEPTQPENDTELTSRTRKVVKRFFTQYAAGDIEAELAPGATIPALPEGMTLESVQSWSAHAGEGDHRTGSAVVVWDVSGAQLTQNYRVELTRVSASSGQRWQVSDVLGGRT
jgi:hypothetical protein